MIAVTRTRTLAVSLLIHAIGIALLLTIRASLPIRVRAPATVTTLQFHAAAPVSPRNLRGSVLSPLRSTPRTFRVPDLSPQRAPPQLSVVVAEPPTIPSAPILLPAAAPRLLELPPAPVRRAPVATGTFGDASVAPAAARAIPARESPVAENFSAAEILFKPRPAYTDEARRLQIEGEVLLEVLFAASGEVRILRTIRGLGHGLDESAVASARQIRFRPAQRGGAAVDSSAVVHIVFQIAH
jgi:TonB family protein